MGFADSEDSGAPQMANNTKLKKLFPRKDQIQDILRKQCSRGEAKNISIKSFVKTSERSNIVSQGTVQNGKKKIFFFSRVQGRVPQMVLIKQ